MLLTKMVSFILLSLHKSFTSYLLNFWTGVSTFSSIEYWLSVSYSSWSSDSTSYCYSSLFPKMGSSFDSWFFPLICYLNNSYCRLSTAKSTRIFLPLYFMSFKAFTAFSACCLDSSCTKAKPFDLLVAWFNGIEMSTIFPNGINNFLKCVSLISNTRFLTINRAFFY